MTGRHETGANELNRPRTQALEHYLQIDVARLAFWLRRKMHWIILCTIFFMLLALIYVAVTPHRYTVTSEILVDPGGLQVVSDDLYNGAEQRDDQLLNVDGKLQTLLSRNVLLRVVKRLDLVNDKEFSLSSSSLSLPGFGLDEQTVRPVASSIIAVEMLKRRVTATRDERSFVITLSVWTGDPEKSVRISDSIIEEFKAELIAADAEGAGRAASTLVARLAALRASVNEAEEAVETFRRENGLRVSSGELVSSQSMTQVDTQFRQARERLITAQSRYEALVAGNVDMVAMQSPTLSSLRAQYATLKQTVDAQSAILGPRHPRKQALDSELNSLRSEIDAELARMKQAAFNELEQARTVVAALEAEAETVSSDVFSDNEAQIKLRELTREAQARSTIYENFLERSRVAAERQQLDSTNVRVISPPVIPRKRSWPPGMKQAALFGAAAGFALGSLGVLFFGIITDMYAERKGGEQRPRTVRTARTARPIAPAQPARRPVRAAVAASPGSLLNAPRTPTAVLRHPRSRHRQHGKLS